MIISTKKGTPKEELEKIVDKFEKQGLDVTLITGKDYNVFGLVGDTTKIDERDVLANPWIDNVTRVSAPCRLGHRLRRREDRQQGKDRRHGRPLQHRERRAGSAHRAGGQGGRRGAVPRRCLQAPHLSLRLSGS